MSNRVLRENGSEPTLYVLKMSRKRTRPEKVLAVLSRVEHGPKVETAFVCQDDSVVAGLQKHGLPCFSFANELDQGVETKAWEEAQSARNAIASSLSSSPFTVKGYDCTECLLAGAVDQFAFLAMVLKLKVKLAGEGFKRIVFIPNQAYASGLPNSSHDDYVVATENDPRATLRRLWSAIAPYALPFLAPFRRDSIIPTFLLYEPVAKSSPPQNKEKRRIMIVATDRPAFASYYSRPASAIAKACLQRGDEVMVATDKTSSTKAFEDAGFEPKRQQRIIFTQLFVAWRRVLRLRSSLVKAFPAEDSEMQALAARSLAEGIASNALRTIGGILIFDHLFRKFRPEVLVSVPDSLQFGMTAIAVARRRKVPSITALAGQIFDHPQYGALNADVIAVNSDSARDIFLRRGIAPERVVVTGMAHLDQNAERAEENRENSQSAKVIMFATENLPLGTTLRMITPVAKFVMDTPKTVLVIRPHPREDSTVYTDFVSSFRSERVSLDATTPLLDLLAKSDVCVTGFSNVAVEAMMFNLPVICINLSGNPDVLGYVEQNAALGVTEERRLPEVLNSALYDNVLRMALRKGRAEFLKKNVYAGDGLASVRIATLIEKIAREDQLNG